MKQLALADDVRTYDAVRPKIRAEVARGEYVTLSDYKKAWAKGSNHPGRTALPRRPEFFADKRIDSAGPK